MTGPFAFGRERLRSWLTSAGIAGGTEVQRSSERNRRAFASAIAGLALRGSSFVVVLISVPLTLGYLGPIRFGMWMTIASVVTLLGATDLGIGNGVLNNIARAFGQADRTAARRYLASGLTALTGIAATFGAIFLVAYPTVPWARLYNVADPTAASEAGPATAAFVATFLVGMPLGLIGQVRSAYQEGFVQSAFAGFGNVTTLVLLLLAIWAKASLPILVLAITTGPIIAGGINLAVLFRLQRPWLAPRRSDITISALRSVVGVGLAFMVLQIAYMVAFSSDRLVVAQVVGPAAVADYSVVYRLFSIPAGLALIAILPLWPAYREAISRSDINWVRVTLRRSLLITIAATVPLAVVLSVTGPAVVKVWTQGGVTPAAGLYPALGAFTVALAVANVFSVLFNGAQAIRFQLSIWVPMAVLNIILSVILASRIGVAGVAIGSVLAVVAVLIVPTTLYVPRLLRRLEDDGSLTLGSTGLDGSRAIDS
jgi:O-antigen/teichoic acid export membrane protein